MRDIDFLAESLASCTTHTAAVIWLDRSFSSQRLLRRSLVDVFLLFQHWLLLLREVVIEWFWVSKRRWVSPHFLWKSLKWWEPLSIAIEILELSSSLLVSSHVLVLEILIHVMRHLRLLGIHETLLIELLSKLLLDHVLLIAARVICCIMWKWRRADLSSWIKAPDRALSILLVSIHGSLIPLKHRFLNHFSLTTGVKSARVLKEGLRHLGSKVRMMLLQRRLITSLPAQMHIHWIELETWWIALGWRLRWFEMRKRLLLVLNKLWLNLLLIILENKTIANKLSVHLWKRGLLMYHAYIS
jgi:hypothetical protein